MLIIKFHALHVMGLGWEGTVLVLAYPMIEEPFEPTMVGTVGNVVRAIVRIIRKCGLQVDANNGSGRIACGDCNGTGICTLIDPCTAHSISRSHYYCTLSTGNHGSNINEYH